MRFFPAEYRFVEYDSYVTETQAFFNLENLLISRQASLRCLSRLRSIACCDLANLRMYSSKLVTKNELRAKVKFKKRDDQTRFHDQT